MGSKFNPLIFSGIDLTGNGGGGGPAGAVQWKSPVSDEANLPVVGNSNADARVVLSTDKIYIWDATASKWVDSGLTVASFGSTPNNAGMSITTTVDGSIVRSNIILQPADPTHPGAVSTGVQSFSGDKTFSDDIIVVGNADIQGNVDSSTGTLIIGPAATTINIGNDASSLQIEAATTELITDTIDLVGSGVVTPFVMVDLLDGGTGIQTMDSLSKSFAQLFKATASGSIQRIRVKAYRSSGLISGGLICTVRSNNGSNLPSSILGQSSVYPMTSVQTIASGNHVDFVFSTTVPVISGTYYWATFSFSPGVVLGAGQSLFLQENNISSYTDGFSAYSVNNGLSWTALGSLGSAPAYDFRAFQVELAPEGALYASIEKIPSGVLLSTANELHLDAGSQVKVLNELSMNSINKIVELLDPTSDQDAATKAYVDSLTTDISLVTKEPTGFPNRTDSIVTFSDLSRTLTITPTGSSFDVYVKGQKFTKSEEEITLTEDSGNHYIYYNHSGVLTDNVVFDPSIFTDNALVAIVYWNNDTGSVYFAEERHGLTMDGATHGYLHTVFGARFISGLALAGFSIDGTGNNASDAQFTSDLGKIRDEDLLIEIAQQNEIPILYREGTLWRKKAADSFPIIYSGTAGYTSLRLPYNNFNGSSWSLQEVVNNGFVLVHFFGTNDKDNGVIGIQGTSSYGDVTAARNAASTEISSLSGLPFAEFVAIGSVVFQTSNGYTNAPKARVRSVDSADYVDFRGTQLYTPAGEATTHSLLSGLANDDHTQYLLASGARSMSGDLVMDNNRVTGLLDPALAQDAATKAYVDSAISGGGTYAGDINRTTFTALDNQTTPTNITGFVFNSSLVRSFDAIVSVQRGSSFAEYSLRGVQKSSSWEMTQDYSGDETGLSFSISTVGQILYTSTSTGSSSTIIFRSRTV